MIVQPFRPECFVGEHQLTAEEHAVGKAFEYLGSYPFYLADDIDAHVRQPFGEHALVAHERDIALDILGGLRLKMAQLVRSLEITGVDDPDLHEDEILKILSEPADDIEQRVQAQSVEAVDQQYRCFGVLIIRTAGQFLPLDRIHRRLHEVVEPAQ